MTLEARTVNMGATPFENLFWDILSAFCPSTAEEYFGTDDTPIAISRVTDVGQSLHRAILYALL